MAFRLTSVAAYGSERAAFRGGLRSALGVPAVALGASYLGYGALVREYRLEELLSSQTLGPQAPGWCHSAYWTIGQGDSDEFILSVRYPEGGHAEILSFDPWTGKLHDRAAVVHTLKPWQFWSLIVGVFALFIGAAIFVGRRKPSRKEP